MRLKQFALFFSLFIPFCSIGQFAYDLNVITTATTFLQLDPPEVNANARGNSNVGSFGDVTEQAALINPALITHSEKSLNANVSFSQIDDFNLRRTLNTGVQSQLSKRHAIGLNLHYYGFQPTNSSDFPINYTAIQGNYGFRVNDHWSLGVGFKYLGINMSMINASTVAGDIGVNYKSHAETDRSDGFRYGIGASAMNLGPRVDYGNGIRKNHISSSINLGGSAGYGLNVGDLYISDEFTLAMSKLLVPSPPTFVVDDNGNFVVDENGDRVVAAGYSNDVTAVKGFYQSFYDAPGDVIRNDDGTYTVEKGSVFQEELREIMWHFGNQLTVDYKDKLAIFFTQGLFLEHRNKGNRKFLSFGAGVSVFDITLQASFITSAINQNILAVDYNRFLFGLSYQLD